MGRIKNKSKKVKSYKPISKTDYDYRKGMYDDSLRLYNTNKIALNQMSQSMLDEISTIPAIRDSLHNVYDRYIATGDTNLSYLSNHETAKVNEPANTDFIRGSSIQPVASMDYFDYFDTPSDGGGIGYYTPIYAKPKQEILPFNKKQPIPIRPNIDITKLTAKQSSAVLGKERKGLLELDGKYQKRWGNKRKQGDNAITSRRHTTADGKYIEDLHWTPGPGNISPDDLHLVDLVDTEDEVLEILNKFYDKYNLSPNF